MFQFLCRFSLVFFINFSPFKPDTENNANVDVQANATTLMPPSKEDRILIKNLYECKGYNVWRVYEQRLDEEQH